MKHWMSLLLCLSLLVCLLSTASASELRSYQLDLSADGEYEKEVATGQVVTVQLVLRRTDSLEKAELYALQTELLYDDSFFSFVPESVITAPGVEWSDLERRDGGRAFYFSFVSFSGGELWEAETVVGSFQLQVTATEGTSRILPVNSLISAQNGRDSFVCTDNSVTFTVTSEPSSTKTPNGTNTAKSEKSRLWQWLLLALAGFFVLLLAFLALFGKRRVRFETNGGTELEPVRVKRGSLLKEPMTPLKPGAEFAGWYRDAAFQKPWRFDCRRVYASMTLYARWK